MENYNFWTDLLATFRASPDVIKIIWSLMLPGVVLGALGLVLRYRLLRHLRAPKPAALAYTVIRQDDDSVEIYRHGDMVDQTYPLILPAPQQRGPSVLEHRQTFGGRDGS
ncbi:hypothetical protein H4S14_000713 [Agrobacterium vitis]|nr:hypothetical protein [Agrobacterium vitis]MBE1436986.1 hypothetical protein [Agrobacterium vitis]